MKYSIEVHEHGLLVRAPMGVPISALSGIANLAKSMGYTHLDAGIAEALNAHTAYVNEESGKQWRQEIEAGVKQEYGDGVCAWLAGTDTGASSKVLALKLAFPMVPPQRKDHPYDPDDIGRCFRFLDRFPDLKRNLPLMKTVSPVWERLVDHWDELRALWDEESPSGRCPKLYDRMQDILYQGK